VKSHGCNPFAEQHIYTLLFGFLMKRKEKKE